MPPAVPPRVKVNTPEGTRRQRTSATRRSPARTMNSVGTVISPSEPRRVVVADDGGRGDARDDDHRGQLAEPAQRVAPGEGQEGRRLVEGAEAGPAEPRAALHEPEPPPRVLVREEGPDERHEEGERHQRVEPAERALAEARDDPLPHGKARENEVRPGEAEPEEHDQRGRGHGRVLARGGGLRQEGPGGLPPGPADGGARSPLAARGRR